jgi:hypothetical protein
MWSILEKNLVANIKGSRLDHELRAIENSSTNQTEDYDIYEVYQTDEDGRRKVILVISKQFQRNIRK